MVECILGRLGPSDTKKTGHELASYSAAWHYHSPRFVSHAIVSLPEYNLLSSGRPSSMRALNAESVWTWRRACLLVLSL